MALFRAVNGQTEATSAADPFLGLLSYLPKDISESVIQLFTKTLEDSLGFKPFHEPEKLVDFLSNLSPASEDTIVKPDTTSPVFWSDFIRHSLATNFTLAKRCCNMEAKADMALALTAMVIGVVNVTTTKENVQKDTTLLEIATLQSQQAQLIVGVAKKNEKALDRIAELERSNKVVRQSNAKVLAENQHLKKQAEEGQKLFVLAQENLVGDMKEMTEAVRAKSNSQHEAITWLTKENQDLKEKYDADMLKLQIRCSTLEKWKKEHEDDLVAETKRHEDEVRDHEEKREKELREERRRRDEQMAFIQTGVNQLAALLDKQEAEQEYQSDQLQDNLRSSTERLEDVEELDLNMEEIWQSMVGELKGLNATVESYGEKIRSLERESRDSAFVSSSELFQA